MTLRLLYPALAQMLWTFAVMVILFDRRRRAFAAGEVRHQDIAQSAEHYPAPARRAAANFANQFETPVLFYALAIMATMVSATNHVMVVLAWGYVATRVAHTLVHVGGNDLRIRAPIFALGIALLFGLWLGVVLKVV